MPDNSFDTVESSQREEILRLVREYVSDNLIKKNSKVTHQDRIPVSGKIIEHDEVCNMVEAALDAWLTTGRFKLPLKKARFILGS